MAVGYGVRWLQVLLSVQRLKHHDAFRWQGHLDSDRQMIGKKMIEHAYVFRLQGIGEQNVIQGTARLPGRVAEQRTHWMQRK